MAERIRCDRCIGDVAKECDRKFAIATDLLLFLDTAAELAISGEYTHSIYAAMGEETIDAVHDQQDDHNKDLTEELQGLLHCRLSEHDITLAVYQSATALRSENPEWVETIENRTRQLLLK